jgi:hypothetical protein
VALPITVDGLIEDTRQLLDEDNTESVSDGKILKQLNIAARSLYHTVAKQYDQMYMEKAAFTTDGTAFLDIPTDAFGRRVEFITYSNGFEQIRIEAVAPSKLRRHSTIRSNYPSCYTTARNSIELFPIPGSGLTGYIHYMKKPSTLVKSMGRIVDATSSVLTLDSLGDDITTDVDTLGAFFNVVDPNTGLIKGTFQAAAIDSTANELTIKTTGLNRTSVYGSTIGTSLTDIASVDDYICVVGGTCVVEMLSDYADYISYMAMSLIKGSLRVPLSQVEMDTLAQLKQTAETLWSGRENDNKVTNKNPYFSRAATYRFRGR